MNYREALQVEWIKVVVMHQIACCGLLGILGKLTIDNRAYEHYYLVVFIRN